MDDRYLTTNELAERCRTTPGTVRYWRHVGYGPKGFRLGKRVLYSEAAVNTWLQEVEASQAEAA